MKKILLILLSSLLILSAAACAKDDPEKETDALTEQPTETVEVDPYEHLPDKTYSGAEFRIATHSGNGYEFYMEEDSSDPIDSALYRRNRAVEGRYNVSIAQIVSPPGDSLYAHTDLLMRNIMAGESAYDMISATVVASGGLVVNACLLDWASFETNRLDQPWWIQPINDEFEIEGHLYTAVGHTCISTLRWTYAIMFNRSQGDDLQISQVVFDAIDEGNWTIDYFNSLVSTIYEDIDGVSGRSVGDFYGFNAEALTNLDIFQFAFDIPMITRDDQGLPQLAFGTEKTHSAIDKVLQLYWHNNGSYISKDTAGIEGKNFVEGRSVFAIMTLDTCFTGLRNLEDNYAILPFPKYDADQQQYMTGMMDNYSIIGIPFDAPDAEMSSVIAEALNIEAERIMYPVWKEESLSKKFVSDEYTAKYLDILLAGRKADMGTLFQQDLGRIAMLFRDIVRSENNTFMSDWAASKESLNSNLQMIIDKYLENAS